MGPEIHGDDADAEMAARRGKRLLFWVVVLFLAINGAILYKVFVGSS